MRTLVRNARGGAAAAAPSPLLTGLVSYWKLDEASGQRNDSHGTNHLSDNNTVTQAAGAKIGNAAQFTRANSEWLSVADNASLAFTNQFSLQAWVWRDSLVLNSGIAAQWTYQTSGSWAFQTDNTGDGADLICFIANALDDAGVNWLRFDSNHVINTWYHLVLVYDGTQSGNTNRLKVYQNGSILSVPTENGTIAASLQNSTGDFVLSDFGGTLDRYWDGRMDEVALWNRALSEPEVGDLYNGGAGLAYPFS